MYKVCKVLIILWTVFCAFGLLYGLYNVSNIEPTNEWEETGITIGITFGILFWFLLWFFPIAGLGIIALLTKPKDKEIKVVEKPKLCPHCGKYYTGNPYYCPFCGNKISDTLK
ncbi:MAG: hypothetical protein ABDH25_04070 [Dictyoglomaceae bacterium]